MYLLKEALGIAATPFDESINVPMIESCVPISSDLP
jgi:hypothetical protein